MGEDRYRILFESIDQGFCIVEVLFDSDGQPVDYRFLEANPAFEQQTGLVDAEGKRMRALAPDHEEHWFEIYGRIASTGEPKRFVAEAVEVGELVSEVATLARPLAGETGLAFLCHVPEGTVEIETDSAKMRHLLMNLLTNAVKFTAEGEIELRAEYEEDRVLFRVRDTGIGIAPEKLEEIFESFSQVEPATTREVGGTGLGLAVSRELARLLGGDITVESTPGEGSTFTVELPLRIEA